MEAESKQTSPPQPLDGKSSFLKRLGQSRIYTHLKNGNRNNNSVVPSGDTNTLELTGSTFVESTSGHDKIIPAVAATTPSK